MPCTGAASKGGTFVNIGRPEKINYQVYILQLLLDDNGKEVGREYSTKFYTWRFRPEVQHHM